jgi:hypothetical protein
VAASRATRTTSPVYLEDITEKFTAFVQTPEVGQAKPGADVTVSSAPAQVKRRNEGDRPTSGRLF